MNLLFRVVVVVVKVVVNGERGELNREREREMKK